MLLQLCSRTGVHKPFLYKARESTFQALRAMWSLWQQSNSGFVAGKQESSGRQYVNKWAGQGVDKGGPSCTVGGNADWSSHCRKKYGISPKQLKMELPFDPAISLLV